MTGRARRAVAAVVLLALAALAASAAAWRTAATLTAQRGEFLASVSRLVGWPIEAGSIDVAWFPPALVARDVSVPDESPYGPGTLAYAEEARFELSLGELADGLADAVVLVGERRKRGHRGSSTGSWRGPSLRTEPHSRCCCTST